MEDTRKGGEEEARGGVAVSLVGGGDAGPDRQQQQQDCAEVVTAVQDFLKPLKDSYAVIAQIGDLSMSASTETKSVTNAIEVPLNLFKSLCQFIWEPDIIYSHPGFLRRLYNQLNYNFNMSSMQTDLEDMLDYKPCEVMAMKASQVFIALVLPDVSLFEEELANFYKLLEDTRIYRDQAAENAYRYMHAVFKALFNALAGKTSCDVEDEEKFNFQSLSKASQSIIHAMSVVFIKPFKTKLKEKVERMQKVVEQDETNPEWHLILGEMMRLARRDSRSRHKWATPEELKHLEKAISLQPESPFVRFAILDTIISAVRESSGRFYCGDIQLHSLDEAMRYLHEHSMKLTEEFPKSVHVNSVVSDYFARYFPHLYFNPDRALELLDMAYKLNPSNPKTTHRYSILWRMSYDNVDESLKWLSKTMALDSTHFPGTFEYFKTILGKLDEYDVPELMNKTLLTPAAAGWTNAERSDFVFYLGIAHFMTGNKEKTLECWRNAITFNEAMFSLEDVLTTSEFFHWDRKKIGIDQIRLWIQKEKVAFESKEKAGELIDKQNKLFLDGLFALMLGFKYPKKLKPQEYFPKSFPLQFMNLVAE